MAIHKRIISILLPALVLVQTHETLPLNRAVGMCARFAGKSLIAATIIGIVSLPLFIKKEDIKDTKTMNNKAFYEQLAKILLGGMGTTAAFDYFAQAKNEEGLITENDLPEVIEVSRVPSDKQLSTEVMSKEVREMAGTVSAVATLVAVGSTVLSWPSKHWPFKRSNKSETTTSANSSDQSSTIPLQVTVDPLFRTQLDEFKTQLENLAASHNGANISEEERQGLLTAFDQKLNEWFNERQETLNFLTNLYQGLLNSGAIPEELKNQEAITAIMNLLGQNINQAFAERQRDLRADLTGVVNQILDGHKTVLAKKLADLEQQRKQIETINEKRGEMDKQRYNDLTKRISELEAFRREAEETQPAQLQTQPHNCSWLSSLNPFKGSDNSDQSDQ